MLWKEDYTPHGETKKGNKDPKDHNLQIPCLVQTKPQRFPTNNKAEERGWSICADPRGGEEMVLAEQETKLT